MLHFNNKIKILTKYEYRPQNRVYYSKCYNPIDYPFFSPTFQRQYARKRVRSTRSQSKLCFLVRSPAFVLYFLEKQGKEFP